MVKVKNKVSSQPRKEVESPWKQAPGGLPCRTAACHSITTPGHTLMLSESEHYSGLTVGPWSPLASLKPS